MSLIATDDDLTVTLTHYDELLSVNFLDLYISVILIVLGKNVTKPRPFTIISLVKCNMSLPQDLRKINNTSPVSGTSSSPNSNQNFADNMVVEEIANTDGNSSHAPLLHRPTPRANYSIDAILGLRQPSVSAAVDTMHRPSTPLTPPTPQRSPVNMVKEHVDTNENGSSHQNGKLQFCNQFTVVKSLLFVMQWRRNYPTLQRKFCGSWFTS